MVNTNQIHLSLLSLIALELAVLIQYTANGTQGVFVRSMAFFASYGSAIAALFVLVAVASGKIQSEN